VQRLWLFSGNPFDSKYHRKRRPIVWSDGKGDISFATALRVFFLQES